MNIRVYIVLSSLCRVHGLYKQCTNIPYANKPCTKYPTQINRAQTYPTQINRAQTYPTQINHAQIYCTLRKLDNICKGQTKMLKRVEVIISTYAHTLEL